MTRDDARQAVFGAFDGLASALGMIAALALGGHSSTVLVAATALAAAAAVSMAFGEWLADPESSPRRAGVMGIATLAGSALPAVPFAFLPGPAAAGGCVLVTVGCASVIAELRPGARWRSYAQTFGVLTVACMAAVAASVATGGF